MNKERGPRSLKKSQKEGWRSLNYNMLQQVLIEVSNLELRQATAAAACSTATATAPATTAGGLPPAAAPAAAAAAATTTTTTATAGGQLKPGGESASLALTKLDRTIELLKLLLDEGNVQKQQLELLKKGVVAAAAAVAPAAAAAVASASAGGANGGGSGGGDASQLTQYQHSLQIKATTDWASRHSGEFFYFHL